MEEEKNLNDYMNKVAARKKAAEQAQKRIIEEKETPKDRLKRTRED